MTKIALQLGPESREVEFNLSTLMRVEERFNLGCLEVAKRLAAYMPSPGPDGRPKVRGETMMAARLTFMLGFVAACADVEVGRATQLVPVEKVWESFYACALGFLAAVMEMTGEPDPGKPAAQAGASGPSEPGPASSSDAAATSSTASAPPTSPG